MSNIKYIVTHAETGEVVTNGYILIDFRGEKFRFDGLAERGRKVLASKIATRPGENPGFSHIYFPNVFKLRIREVEEEK